MPGVVMDNTNIEGSARRPGLNEPPNDVLGSFGDNEKSDQTGPSANGPVHVNGTGRGLIALSQTMGKQDSESEKIIPAPFELPHITQGFFPFGTLVNRAVQQCWNDLSELITELAAIRVPSDAPAASSANGKSADNQTSENVQKKLRVLNFAHAKRVEFIKLLVLSQWSQQASEISRLIDIQGFVRARHQAYAAAVQYVGEMKRDLVRAQVANPDLRTALEVLSKGRVASLPDFGYEPPKRLTPRATLRKLHKINRIIKIRLSLHDQVPDPLRNYRVHDGRVTFIVPGEFELDLSVAEQAKTSQFFFVDIRFLFFPSSPIPRGRIFNELDVKVNEILRNEGLMGCFHFLHGLVLTNKVNTLFRQAIDLARGTWSDALRAELLHRTLVVQYWQSRPGPKSWLEIGVQKSQRVDGTKTTSDAVPRLGLRWMRNGQQAESEAIRFDSDTLSVERILRSVIALHTAHLLSTSYAALRKNLLYHNHALSLRAQLSSEEPGDCYLDVQLTPSRYLRVSVEPLSGAITLSGTPSVSERFEGERVPSQSTTEELLSRVARLRCITAVDEIETGTKGLGLESVNQRGLGLDVRRLFPPSVLRSMFFTHKLWDRRWAAAATSSMDGDNWWLVQLRSADTSRAPHGVNGHALKVPLAHVVSSTLMTPQQRFKYTACAELLHGLTGILAIYANARCLAELPDAHFHPPLEKVQLGSNLEVPNLFFRYKTSMLPAALRIASGPGLDRGSYLQDTIRLSFHGIDRQSHSAVLVAYGTLRFRVKSLLFLVSKMDPSLLMQDKGGGFALRLLVPAGQPVIFPLFARLQQLDCVLSVLQSLIQKGIAPRSLSLSQVTFSYGPDNRLSGRFDIDVLGPSLSDYIDMRHALSKNDPLFHLRLRVGFESPSPHRRISESLTVALNRRFADTGVEYVLGSMSDTLPLLRCFDEITTKPPQSGSNVVHVTVRGPTVFQIHYPRLKTRLRLSVRPCKGRMVWVLEDTSQSGASGRGQILTVLKDKVYDAKGEGWQGLGDGAMSSIDKVGNLLFGLHECLGTCHLEPIVKEGEGKPEQPDTAQKLSREGPAVAVAHPQNAPPQKAGAMTNADIITID